MEEELKLTRFEWFETLPPDLAKKAITYAELHRSAHEEEYEFSSLSDALTSSFGWDRTEEGHAFWESLASAVAEPGHTFFRIGEVYKLRDGGPGTDIRVTDIAPTLIAGVHANNHDIFIHFWHPSGIFFTREKPGQPRVRSKKDDLIPHNYNYIQPVYAWKKPTTEQRALILD